MDLRSIVRAFRFGEMQRRSESDPGAKRPPTILFAAIFVALLAATAGVGAGIYYLQDRSSPDGQPLATEDPTPSDTQGNDTSPSQTTPPALVGSQGAQPGPIRRF